MTGKRLRRQLHKAAAMILAVSLGGSCLFPMHALADKSDRQQELEDQIEGVKDELDALEDKQQDTEDELNRLKNDKGTLQLKLNTLTETLTEVSANIESLNAQIVSKTEDIERAEADLEAAQEEEAQQYANMVERLRKMYERGSGTVLQELLRGNTISQILNKAEYMERIENYEHRKMQELIAVREDIEEKKQTLEEEEAELQTLHRHAEEESQRLTDLIEEAKADLATYRDLIDDAEAEAYELEKKQKEKEEDLEYLKKLLEEEKRKSREALDGTWRSITDVTFEEGDEYLLANLIYCEAGNQPYEGQVAVGAVVINRVLSGAFPSTIPGVIYQHNQFEPAMTGRLALALSRNDATPACYAAADAAMAGQTTVSDCIFFRTPIPQVTPRYVIGGHIFY
jgi:spore germination cell wall hydrolase CwlJ-like protein/outer membrane murein-binding lipoprotein Lpp